MISGWRYIFVNNFIDDKIIVNKPVLVNICMYSRKDGTGTSYKLKYGVIINYDVILWREIKEIEISLLWCASFAAWLILTYLDNSLVICFMKFQV